jgi:hypothetical protein
MLQESFIRGRLSEDAFAENAIRSQLGPISTSVVVAVAGERSSLVQTRDIIGSSVVTGDHNIVTTTMRQVAPAPADQVDVRAELAALQQLLAQLKNVPDRGRLGRAMQDAVEEVAKPEPDKAEVGNALERVTRCAKAASDFTENAEKIVPRLVALGSWLGPAGRALLNSLGVAI